jgi:predicted metal-dependent hydrolase
MAQKTFALNERTSITIYKRRGNRNLRLSVTASGQVRVSIPAWAPYKTGITFAKARLDWIERHSVEQSQSLLQPGQAIGKAHRLRFSSSPAVLKVSSRVYGSDVIITHPAGLGYEEKSVQQKAEQAAIRALRSQASQLLPQRLAALAKQHGFAYRSVRIKQLKSRWGSCDQQGNIVLNLYLLQLPWECIDYVLLHELTHTNVMQHGPVFWQAMAEVLPSVTERRKTMKNYQPILHRPLSESMA